MTGEVSVHLAGDNQYELYGLSALLSSAGYRVSRGAVKESDLLIISLSDVPLTGWGHYLWRIRQWCEGCESHHVLILLPEKLQGLQILSAYGTVYRGRVQAEALQDKVKQLVSGEVREARDWAEGLTPGEKNSLPEWLAVSSGRRRKLCGSNDALYQMCSRVMLRAGIRTSQAFLLGGEMVPLWLMSEVARSGMR